MSPAALSLLLCTALAAGAAPWPRDADRPEPADVKTLVGEWQLTSTSDENRTTPGNRLLRMIVEQGGRVRFLLAGEQTTSGTFVSAKAVGKLKSINLKTTGGQTLLGVYGLDGDTLLLCFAEEGKPRPDSLKPTGTQWAERWRRVGKEKRPQTNHCIEPPTEESKKR